MLNKLIMFFLLIVSTLKADINNHVKELPDLKIGSDKAQVKLIEYSSINCGYCGIFHNEMFDYINRKFIKTGKIQYIYRHFPLDSQAVDAMVLIAKQPKVQWHTLIKKAYKHQEKWVLEENLNKLVEILGLNHIKDVEKYIKCDKTISLVSAKRYNIEQSIKIEATPMFIVQYNENGMQEQKLIDDELPSLKEMEEILNYALEDPSKLQTQIGLFKYIKRLFT